MVSQEAKLWLLQGELPFGSAADAGLTGMLALPIGEWAGDPVWLVRQTRDMGSVRQILNAEPGLFQVEVGETLGQCVAREVMEETQVQVKKCALRDLPALAVFPFADGGVYGLL